MPSKRAGRGGRVRRQPPPRKPIAQRPEVEAVEARDGIAPASVSQASVRPQIRSSARRSRAPAQIVIANYDFLRHDLRLLGMLAPTLIVVLVVLSYIIH